MIVFWLVLSFLFSNPTLTFAAFIQNNGYSDVVVAISDRVSDPSNPLMGYNFIEDLKDDIRTASQALFLATRQRAYFKDVIILLPSSWQQYNIDGNSNEFTFETADFRIVPTARDLRPTTSQSGFCGIAGNYIEAPVQFFQSADTEQRAKILVAEWSKYRYGVFDEIGRSNDSASPLFYTNPQGDKVLNSCNNTIIDGIIENETSFKPDPSQSATSSLMAFPELASVIDYCDSSNHDPIPPTRQNLLCNYKSIWEVVGQSDDFRDGQNPPLNGDIGQTTFTILTVSRTPVIHVVIDISADMGVNALSVPRRTILNIVNSDLLPADASMAVSTFSGSAGPGKYLKDICPPLSVRLEKIELQTCLGSLNYVTADGTRDSGAAMRDAALELSSYQDAGGSIIYLVTVFMNQGSAVKELDMVELLLANNIQLIAVELALDPQETRRNMRRIANLTDGFSFSSPTINDWTIVNNAARDQLVISSQSPIVSKKTTIFKNDHSGLLTGNSVEDEFLIPIDRGMDTVLSIQSSNSGDVTVILTNADSESYTFSTNFVAGSLTNWDIPNTSFLYVDSFYVPDSSTGLWSYSVSYQTNNVGQQSDLFLQVISGKNQTVQNVYDPRIWTSTTLVDLSITPFVIIFAQVESTEGRLTGLVVKTEVLKQELGSSPDTIDLTEDLYSGGGVYSGVFRPSSDGIYAISAFFEAASTCTDPAGLCAPDDFQASLLSAVFVEVTGAVLVDPIPTRITDLALVMTDGSPQDQDLYVTLTWTAPSLSPTTPALPVTGYEVRYSEDFDTLLNGFDNCIEVNYIDTGVAFPGNTVSYDVSVSGGENNVFFFAVRSIGINDAKSDISNIVWNSLEGETTTDSSIPTDPFTTDLSNSNTPFVTQDLTDTSDNPTTTSTTSTSDNPTRAPTSTSTSVDTNPSTIAPETDSTANPMSSTNAVDQSTTEKPYVPIQQTPGFIIGMSLGMACLIGILVLLLICFYGNLEDDQPQNVQVQPTVIPVSTFDEGPKNMLPRAYLRSPSYYENLKTPYQRLSDDSPNQSRTDVSYYV